MVTIHHLERSASERVIWLMEELELPYRIERYSREPTFVAPPEYKALHPMGASPVIEDDAVVLAESSAIVQYIMGRYGKGRLSIEPQDARFSSFLYWFHFANGTLQPSLVRALLFRTLKLEATDGIAKAVSQRLGAAIDLIETHLRENAYFAGGVFSAADIMMVFSLTTMRLYQPIDLSPYPHIGTYLQRIGERTSYRRAMEVANPGFAPLLT